MSARVGRAAAALALALLGGCTGDGPDGAASGPVTDPPATDAGAGETDEEPSVSAEDGAYLDAAAVLIGHVIEVAELIYGFGAFEALTPLALQVRDAQQEQLDAVQALRDEAGLAATAPPLEDVDAPSGDAFEALTDGDERDTLVLEDLRVRLARVAEASQRHLADSGEDASPEVRELAAAVEADALAQLADVDAALSERGIDPPPPPGS